MDRAAYYLALEGVTRFGLSEAVKAIMKGVLGHAFMPSPPELRIQCDKAMEHHEAMRERIARRERTRAETPLELPPLTDAQRDRQRRLMERFHAGINGTKAAEEAARVQAEREDIRARYGMTPEAVASIQDNPKARERMGNL